VWGSCNITVMFAPDSDIPGGEGRRGAPALHALVHRDVTLALEVVRTTCPCDCAPHGTGTTRRFSNGNIAAHV
jgi:hypothetical protein